ncbi:MAG TPA: metallophosphoesterase family protein [Candidatus Acidoferrum sp.]|nr:metallophosphoesterase family protein [Candidatus Acidoferrum sp.]
MRGSRKADAENPRNPAEKPPKQQPANNSWRDAIREDSAPRNPQKIGLISDTHGLLREEALQALRGSELIIHAGDVGDPEILEALRKIAPVIAVRGNVDTAEWARALPETAVAEAGGVHIYVLHDVHALDLNARAAGFSIVVSGHSHKPSRSERDGVTYINPGSAGPRRFDLPITVARLDLEARPWGMEFIDLEKGRTVK